ncbi:AMP-binding enzyme [Prauserella halophila]|nr:AMP-binding enzyme [Prauserella halophila]
MELDRASDRVAAALAARGVEAGQTVSLFSQNRWEWVVAYHGALKAGRGDPVNVMLTTEEFGFVLRDCDSAAVSVGGDQAAATVDEAKALPSLRMVVSFDGAATGAVAFA